ELALDASETIHQKQLLSTVKAAARNLLHVINDLLDFSKITAGKLALDLADFSLRAAVGDTLRALAVRAHRKGLELGSHVQQAGLEGLEVLVVDDNESNRTILLEWFADWRMRAAAVGDAVSTFDALERAQDAGAPFALVLLDSRMPDIDGITLAQRIRERFGQ